MSEYTNPIFNVFPEQVEDNSIEQFEYIRYNEINGLEVTNFTGPTLKIVTKDLHNYLWNRGGILDIVLRVTVNGAFTLGENTTKMHDSILSVFRKASYFKNSVLVDEIEYPGMCTQVRNLLEYSDDYVTKQGRLQGFHYESGDGAFDNTNFRVTQLSDGVNAKRLRVQIPLARIFAYFNAYPAVEIGIEHRYEFVKETIISNIVFGTNCDAERVVFDECSIWIPKVVPSLDAQRQYLTALSSKSETLVSYEAWNGYRNSFNNPNGIPNLTWQISAISRKPKFVFVMLQYGPRLDEKDGAGAEFNPSLFDNALVTNIELKVNSKRFPDDRYTIRFDASTAGQADDYIRPYLDFLRIMDKDTEYDNGSLVSYADYKTKYPIFAFDLSREHSLYENVQTNYISVEIIFNNSVLPIPPANPLFTKIYTNAIIVWDKELKVGGSQKALELIRK